MNIQIKTGDLSDFFSSARETAKQIDEVQSVTPKHAIWIEPDDLPALLKPARKKLIQYLRLHNKVVFKHLINAMNRTPVSLNHDLALLLKYELIQVSKEPNAGHGIQKVIKPRFNNQPIEFRVAI